MKERQLRYIQAIAREGTIQKAASVLSKNPSTLARALKQSEEFFGVPLFLRTSDGMVLTTEGRKIVRQTEELLTMFDRLREWTDQWFQKTGPKGAVSCGNGERGRWWSETEIHYLLTVSQEGSISQAARKLYLTQPALSQAVRDIEKELGTSVFCRIPKGVEETAFGRELLKRLEEIYENYWRTLICSSLKR